MGRIETYTPTGDPVEIRASSKNMRQEFNGCEPDYIRDVCHAACCRSSVVPEGFQVVVHKSEEDALRALGAKIEGGRIRPQEPGQKHCPFEEQPSHLCALYNNEARPWGCGAPPFALAPGWRTLIVRNRYRLLKCYKDGRRLPAYRAFASSLAQVLGEAEAIRLTAHLDDGGGDLQVQMPRRSFDLLVHKTEASLGARNDTQQGNPDHA